MYRISKVLNHNTVIGIHADDNQEYLVMGKGIGFGKKVSERFEVRDGDTVYSLQATSNRGSAKELATSIQPIYLEIANEILDEAGFEKAIVCASGDLDERSISSLLNQGAKINSWGVGTKLITSEEMPALGGVYKLAAVVKEDGTIVPKIKLSDNAEKITNPSFKNLFRLYDKKTGKAVADTR